MRNLLLITQCAVCGQVKECEWCSICGKWICADDKYNLPARAKAAVRERLHF